MKSEDIFRAGYAIPLYDITSEHVTCRFWDEDIRIPRVYVNAHRIPGVNFDLFRIEDVRSVAIKQ